MKITEYEDGSVGYEYENGDFVELVRPVSGALATIEPGAWGKVYGLRDRDKFRSSFDVQLGGWCKSRNAFIQSVGVLKWDVKPYHTQTPEPFPEPPPPPPKDYSDRIETYCLYIDNDEPSLRNMMRLFGEILSRKHGDRDRMLSEFLRRKHLFESKNVAQSLWAITMNRSAWMEVFEHYETKYMEGVR